MIPFFVFFGCAISSGLLTHTWMGSPAERALGYAGAAALMLAAYVSAVTLWGGRYIAALGVALVAAYCLCENMGLPPRVFNIESVCSLVFLAITGAYIVGSFRVSGSPHFLYPRQTSLRGKWTVGAIFCAMAIGVCWLGHWRNAVEVQRRVVAARWEAVQLDRVTSGRRQVKFTALDSSMSVTVASDELYQALESARKTSVNVEITETFKHGAMVACGIESIDGSTDFSLLDLEPPKLNP